MRSLLPLLRLLPLLASALLLLRTSRAPLGSP